MAITGFSYPYVGKYVSTGEGVVTYEDGISLGRAAEYSLSIESGEQNNLYLNNRVAETAGGNFTSGELSITLGELTKEAAKYILGTKEVTEDVNGTSVTKLQFSGKDEAPLLGIGFIERGMVKGATSYTAAILRKVKFGVPEFAATTGEEEIEWQTQELTATVMVDDTEETLWLEKIHFDTEQGARDYLKQYFKAETGAPVTPARASVKTETGDKK